MASSDPGPNGSDSDVFGSLPRSRPQRRSAKRDRPAARASAATGAPPKARATKAGGARSTAKPRKRAATASAGAAKDSAAARAPQPPPQSAVPPAGYATPRDREDPALQGLRLLATAVEALGELFVIGLTATSQALRQALHRLPRP